MTPRLLAGVACAALIAAVVGPALWRLPGLGATPKPYARAAIAASVDDRATANVVAGISYDLRAFDTIGEELILITAVAGVGVLLRPTGRSRRARDEDRVDRAERAHAASRPAVRRIGATTFAISIVFGVAMTAHATVSPGGGFQGGAVIASGVLLIYLAWSYRVWAAIVPEGTAAGAEAAGALAFLVIALVPIVVASPILTNWLGLRPLGALASGGTMFVINFAIGLAVAAGFVVIAREVLIDLHEREEPR